MKKSKALVSHFKMEPINKKQHGGRGACGYRKIINGEVLIIFQ